MKAIEELRKACEENVTDQNVEEVVKNVLKELIQLCGCKSQNHDYVVGELPDHKCIPYKSEYPEPLLKMGLIKKVRCEDGVEYFIYLNHRVDEFFDRLIDDGTVVGVKSK